LQGVICSSKFQTSFLTAKSFKSADLKLRQHSLSTTNRDLAARLLLRIRDLAVIDNHRVPRGALAHCPAELLGECCAGVGEEELLGLYQYQHTVSYINIQKYPCIARGGRRTGTRNWETRETYDRIILDAIRLSPGTHNPRIIERNDSNDIDAFAFELSPVGDVAREVLGATARGESAGDGEEDDLFVGPFCFVALVRVDWVVGRRERGWRGNGWR